MDIELSQNRQGLYEIWVDKQCLPPIPRKAGESGAAYQQRAEAEFDAYVAKLKNLKDGKGGAARSVKKITL